MESQIDPDLLPITSGPDIGKLSADDLRLQLTRARDESTAHGTNIENITEAVDNLVQATNTALAEKINSTAVPGVVRGAVLTGLSFAATTAIDAADSVLVALGKLQAQITKIVDQVNIFTKAQRSRGVVLAPAANIYTPDFAAALFFRLTPAGNFTLANPANMPTAGDHQSGSFFITQDPTGGRLITFGDKYQATGIVLSTAPNAIDRIDYLVSPGGNIHLSITKGVPA